MYRETIAVFSEIHTKQTHTPVCVCVRGQNLEFFKVESGDTGLIFKIIFSWELN